MAAPKASPILSLTSSAIGNFDVNDSSCLASMWAVFSKCASSIENGRRLENLSWRLWTREALFDEALIHHQEQEEGSVSDASSSGPEDHSMSSSDDDEYYSTTEQEEDDDDETSNIHPHITARLRNKAVNRHELKTSRPFGAAHPRQSQPQNIRARLHRNKSATITAASIPRHHGDHHLRTQQFKHTVVHQPQKPICHFYQHHKKANSSSGCSYQHHHHHNQDKKVTIHPPIPHCTRRIKSSSSAKTEEGCYQHLQGEVRSPKSSSSSLRPKLSCERIKQIIDSFTPASEESNIWSQKLQGDPLISQSDSSLPAYGRKNKENKNNNQDNNNKQSSSIKPTTSQSISNAEAQRRTRASTDSPEKNPLTSALSKSSLDLSSGSNPRKSPSVVRGFHPIIDYKSILAANNVSPPSPQLGHQIESAHATSDLSAAKGSSTAAAANPKKGMFFFESSPEDSDGFGDSVRSAVVHSGAQPVKLDSFRPRVKTVDFKSGIETHESPVYESDEVAVEDGDDEDDDDDDDDDEDDSDWDSIDDSQPASFDEKTMFHRGRPLLATRPSMLSTLFTQQKTKLPSRSAAALASQRESSEGSAVFEDDEDEDDDEPQNFSFQKAGTICKASNNQAIGGMSVPIPSNHQNRNDPLLSPRSTRRNMIASELSESLRRNLLWERKQKTPQVLTRARTSCDLTQLDQDKQQQQPPTRKTSLNEESQKEPWTVDNLSTSDYISEHGYHSRGW